MQSEVFFVSNEISNRIIPKFCYNQPQDESNEGVVETTTCEDEFQKRILNVIVASLFVQQQGTDQPLIAEGCDDKCILGSAFQCLGSPQLLGFGTRLVPEANGFFNSVSSSPSTDLNSSPRSSAAIVDVLAKRLCAEVVRNKSELDAFELSCRRQMSSLLPSVLHLSHSSSSQQGGIRRDTSPGSDTGNKTWSDFWPSAEFIEPFETLNVLFGRKRELPREGPSVDNSGSTKPSFPRRCAASDASYYYTQLMASCLALEALLRAMSTKKKANSHRREEGEQPPLAAGQIEAAKVSSASHRAEVRVSIMLHENIRDLFCFEDSDDNDELSTVSAEDRRFAPQSGGDDCEKDCSLPCSPSLHRHCHCHRHEKGRANLPRRWLGALLWVVFAHAGGLHLRNMTLHGVLLPLPTTAMARERRNDEGRVAPTHNYAFNFREQREHMYVTTVRFLSTLAMYCLSETLIFAGFLDGEEANTPDSELPTLSDAGSEGKRPLVCGRCGANDPATAVRETNEEGNKPETDGGICAASSIKQSSEDEEHGEEALLVGMWNTFKTCLEKGSGAPLVGSVVTFSFLEHLLRIGGTCGRAEVEEGHSSKNTHSKREGTTGTRATEACPAACYSRNLSVAPPYEPHRIRDGAKFIGFDSLLRCTTTHGCGQGASGFVQEQSRLTSGTFGFSADAHGDVYELRPSLVAFDVCVSAARQLMAMTDRSYEEGSQLHGSDEAFSALVLAQSIFSFLHGLLESQQGPNMRDELVHFKGCTAYFDSLVLSREEKEKVAMNTSSPSMDCCFSNQNNENERPIRAEWWCGVSGSFNTRPDPAKDAMRLVSVIVSAIVSSNYAFAITTGKGGNKDLAHMLLAVQRSCESLSATNSNACCIPHHQLVDMHRSLTSFSRVFDTTESVLCSIFRSFSSCLMKVRETHGRTVSSSSRVQQDHSHSVSADVEKEGVAASTYSSSLSRFLSLFVRGTSQHRGRNDDDDGVGEHNSISLDDVMIPLPPRRPTAVGTGVEATQTSPPRRVRFSSDPYYFATDDPPKAQPILKTSLTMAQRFGASEGSVGMHAEENQSGARGGVPNATPNESRGEAVSPLFNERSLSDELRTFLVQYFDAKESDKEEEAVGIFSEEPSIQNPAGVHGGERAVSLSTLITNMYRISRKIDSSLASSPRCSAGTYLYSSNPGQPDGGPPLSGRATFRSEGICLCQTNSDRRALAVKTSFLDRFIQIFCVEAESPNRRSADGVGDDGASAKAERSSKRAKPIQTAKEAAWQWLLSCPPSKWWECDSPSSNAKTNEHVSNLRDGFTSTNTSTPSRPPFFVILCDLLPRVLALYILGGRSSSMRACPSECKCKGNEDWSCGPHQCTREGGTDDSQSLPLGRGRRTHAPNSSGTNATVHGNTRRKDGNGDHANALRTEEREAQRILSRLCGLLERVLAPADALNSKKPSALYGSVGHATVGVVVLLGDLLALV